MQAHRTAGSFFASLGGALGLSLLAHAAGLGALLWSLQPAGRPTMARHKGAMVVTLASPRAPAPPSRVQPTVVPAAQAMATLSPAPDPAPKRTADAAPLQSPTPTPTPSADAAHPAPRQPAAPPHPEPATASSDEAKTTSADAVPTATPAPETPGATEAPSPTPAPAAPTNPGARFSSLFAPVSTKPMGRGRWRSTPPPVPPPDAMAQQQLALAGLRQSLMARIAQAQPGLRQDPLQGRCDIRLDLTRRQAQVQCSEAREAARMWTLLDQLLTAGQVDPAAAPACIHAESHDIRWQACDTLPPP